jgi:hypothetical protein
MFIIFCLLKFGRNLDTAKNVLFQKNQKNIARETYEKNER